MSIQHHNIKLHTVSPMMNSPVLRPPSFVQP